MCVLSVRWEGCGSKWVLVGVGNRIVARLVECPLCTDKKMERIGISANRSEVKKLEQSGKTLWKWLFP